MIDAFTATDVVSWTLVTGPVEEPITLAEAKAQARITDTNSDALIASYIKAAREAAEEYMNRGLFTQTWKLTRRAFAEVMYLPRAAPLQSVSVQYYDANAALQTLASTFYTVDTVSRPGRIVRASNQLWPALQTDRLDGAVIITYVIGWASTALIPERIKQGIRLYVANLHEDREGIEPGSAQARDAAEACWTDRVHWIETCV